MRSLFVLCALLGLLAANACQSPQSLREKASLEALPEDLEQRYVHQIVGSLRDGFAAGDTAGFMKYVSDGFYKGYARLEEGLEKEFRKGKGLFLEVAVVEIVDEELRVTAAVRWKRSASPGGTELLRGETLLVFHKADALSLVDFRGGSLFGISGF